MIASPCKDCPNRNLPKDLCMKTCKALKEIQSFHTVFSTSDERSAIDHSAEDRYYLSQFQFKGSAGLSFD